LGPTAAPYLQLLHFDQFLSQVMRLLMRSVLGNGLVGLFENPFSPTRSTHLC
jgi:hypothetical protein